MRQYSETAGRGSPETREKRVEFWKQFVDCLKSKNTALRVPQISHRAWTTFPLGRGGFKLSAAMLLQKEQIGVSLVMGGPGAKQNFRALFGERAAREVWDIGEPHDRIETGVARARPGTGGLSQQGGHQKGENEKE